ncbi:Lipoamide acyltransferase component of branched-chain alpha-keto acid dehydrogenase complex, mitochondrial [Wickerhamiella sorbophila]|uniref:Dihydrolipoamide acetyltransferase component of pyruvate dehydrogenase complex n=1 Tax=Wickerhamiella sorbophila TaxID=45607 RepID=A0A2T0FIA7_9ASCO|nr:Lipoamide acyltransferase component of branched-chain alpha-keto acid dehydrogenase complex, mitochondrial [Wickerhamiella sorbophila]PRT54733.1 Lipoamide acyltransferase component of branched-chain alpha-keto acid dehydrogenase complex, mitochondrial [Wickerhamiella sorbophila]
MFRIARVVRARAFSSSRYVQALKPFLLADVGEGIKECEVIQWMIQPGARLEEFDPVCELQSDKATVEITSRFSGVVKKLHYDVGDMAQVGQPLLDMEVADNTVTDEPEPVQNTQEQDSLAPATESEPVEPPQHPTSDFIKALATPAVRRLCRENDIDITSINGSGKSGRVMKEDVLAFLAGGSSAATGTAAAPASTSIPEVASLTPIKGVAKQMFGSMSASTSIPHFLFTEEIVMNKLMALRKRVNSSLTGGQKLSYMPFMIKALSLSIKTAPIVNSRYVEDPVKGPCIETRPAHNISIAMDTPQGLVVPVIKNVERKSVMEIANDLVRLQELGAAGKLTSDDLQGGTITLSNIGTVGGTYVAPVLVSSQVAIGAVGAIKKRPVFDENDNIVAAHVMMTSWSGDHRILDGVTLAKAVMRWKHYLEQPEDMLLELV